MAGVFNSRRININGLAVFVKFDFLDLILLPLLFFMTINQTLRKSQLLLEIYRNCFYFLLKTQYVNVYLSNNYCLL